MFGVVRFNSGITLNKLIMADNLIKSVSNNNYTVRGENTAFLTNANIHDNTIDHGSVQNGSGDRAAMRIQNIADSKVHHNILIVNTDGIESSNKAIWMPGVVDRVSLDDNTVKSEVGTGTSVALDLRGAGVTNCQIKHNTVDGLSAAATQIQMQAGNNNLEFLNLVNGVYEKLTPLIIV